MLIVCILCGQSFQVFAAQVQVVQLVFKDDARMEQTVFYQIVTLGNLFFGKRYLRQIVFALMRVVQGGGVWLLLVIFFLII